MKTKHTPQNGYAIPVRSPESAEAVQQLNMVSVDSASEKRKRQLAFKIANPASWHKQNSETRPGLNPEHMGSSLE